jgi:hypothetical protein
MAQGDPQEELERERLQIEREKLELDKRRWENEDRFFNKNFGVIVTCIASLAATLSAGILSYSQIHVANLSQQHEIEMQNKKQDRDWNLDVLKFVSDHQDLIFSNEPSKRQHIQDVILVVFPPNIANALFHKLEETATSSDQLLGYRQAQQTAASLGSGSESAPASTQKVFLQYQDPDDSPFMDGLSNQLVEAKFRVQGKQLVTGKTNGDIRYYHQDDANAAKEIKGMFEHYLETEGRAQKVQLLYLGDRFKNVPEGVIEVWLERRPKAK